MVIHKILILGILFIDSRVRTSGHIQDSHVDLNNLIVITDKFSEGSSFFGFSLALWNNANSGGNKSWALIGAPKSNYSGSSSNNGINEPGVLWRCSLNGAQGQDTCEILPIDPSKSGARDCRPVKCPNELKDDSSLGFTITRSTTDPSRVVICAPQWKREENPKRGNFKFNGLCYWLPSEMVESEPFEMSSMLRNNFTSQRLFPFVDAGMQTVSRFPVWSSGQVGFSSQLAPDGTLYLGAPGVRGWNGSIVRYRDGWSDDEWEYERSNRYQQTEFSKFDVLKTEFVEHFYHLEYFGYAVTSGLFVRNHYEPTPTPLVAAGAPRGGLLKGIVLVFRYPEHSAWLPDIIVRGSQFGSYFGSVLCAVDINGDGFDELLVGSPFENLSLEKESVQAAVGEDPLEESTIQRDSMSEGLHIGDQGCVFVYSSKIELYTFGEAEIICGTKIPGSKFGSSIAAIGDIDLDGFNDFAIGAPFENDGEGAVYIYYGKLNFGLNTEPHDYYKKITPSILKIPLSSFGISIFGGVDLDGNETPDFAIGSHVSQSVVIVRTRASIVFEGRVDVFINDTEEAEKLPLETTDITIRSCNRLLKGPHHSLFSLTIRLTTDEDLGRFTITESFDGVNFTKVGNYTIEYQINMAFNQTICLEWLALNTAEIDDETHHPQPLSISQYLIYEEEFHDVNAELTRQYLIYKDENGEPQLNVSGPGFHEFCSFCPPRTSLTTDYHLPIAVDNCMDDGDPICTPELKMYFYHLDGHTSETDKFVIGSGTMYTLRVQLENAENAETVYFPMLDITWQSPPLPEVAPECKLKLTENINRASDVLVRCDLGYTLQRNETTQSEVRLFMHGIYAKKRKEAYNFEVTAYPSKDHHHINKTKAILPLILEADVESFISGSSEALIFSNESFTDLTQTFRISILGESPVDSVYMTFWFPLKVDGKNEEQLISVSQSERNSCWGLNSEGMFDLEKYEEYKSISLATNRKPTKEHKTKEKHPVLSSKLASVPKSHWKSNKKDFNLHCEHGDDKNCLQVLCETANIVPNHNIMLEFRLTVNNELARTILKKKKRSVLEVDTVGFVQILDDTPKFTTANARISEFLVTPVQVEVYVSIWVYLVGGIAGLIIWILLILLLGKCGFFQRPVLVRAEVHAQVAEEPQAWARWEYSQLYSPN